jgi:hypothetical protein
MALYPFCEAGVAAVRAGAPFPFEVGQTRRPRQILNAPIINTEVFQHQAYLPSVPADRGDRP